MYQIGPANTQPEIVVKPMLHGHRFRFRLHRRDLSGTPGIVLPRIGAVVSCTDASGTAADA